LQSRREGRTGGDRCWERCRLLEENEMGQRHSTPSNTDALRGSGTAFRAKRKREGRKSTHPHSLIRTACLRSRVGRRREGEREGEVRCSVRARTRFERRCERR